MDGFQLENPTNPRVDKFILNDVYIVDRFILVNGNYKVLIVDRFNITLN